MYRRIVLALAVLFATAAGGCLFDFLSSESGPTFSTIAIGETEFLASSDPVAPSDEPAHDGSLTRVTFALGSVPLVRDGRFDEVEIRYRSGSACLAEIQARKVATGKWVTICPASSPDEECYRVDLRGPLSQSITFDEFGFDARDFVGAPGVLGVRIGAPFDGSEVVVHERNPRYRPFRLEIPEIESRGWYAGDLAYDGADLWTIGGVDRYGLYRVGADGRLVLRKDLSALLSDSLTPGSIAWGDGAFWMFANRPGGGGIWNSAQRVYKLDRRGDVVATLSFATRPRVLGVLAYGDGKLWMLDDLPPRTRLLAIDAAQSFATGVPVVVDSVKLSDIPGIGASTIGGIEWDGRRVLMHVFAHDRANPDTLFVLRPESAVTEPMVVRTPSWSGYAWDGGALLALIDRGHLFRRRRDDIAIIRVTIP